METPPPNPATPPRPAPPGAHLEAYRLALFLTGAPEKAAAILREAAAAVTPQVAALRSPERKREWFLRQVRERAAALPLSDGGGPLAKTAALPEPARSAYALFQCVNAPVEALASWLGLPLPAYADAVAKARAALAGPEGEFPQDPSLRLHRPWGGDSAAVAKAAQGAGAPLRAQAAVDERWHEEVTKTALPENLALPEWPSPASADLGTTLRQPAVLAIGVALLVVIGVAVFLGLRKIDNFPGREFVTDLVAEADVFSSIPVEPIEPTEADRLGDWFMLKGFEDFSVPEELEGAMAVGGRVLKFHGRPVAEVTLAKRGALLYVFRSGEMNSNAWYIYQQQELAVATREDENNGFAIVFPGDADEMPAFLHEAGGK